MNAIHTMRPGATIVADDVSSRSPGSLRAWHELVLAGYIRDEQCNDNGPEAEVANTQVS